MVLYRFAASRAVRASPLVVLAATARGGSSPVTSQSTVTFAPLGDAGQIERGEAAGAAEGLR